MRKIDISREDLEYKYVKCFQSTTVIALYFGCCEETIRNKLKEYRICRRKGNVKTVTTIKISESATNRAYLAGIVDGEGSIIFVKNPRSAGGISLCVQVKNTDLSLMNWIKENFGGNFHGYKPPKSPLYKIAYCWKVCGTLDMLLILKAISPYLVIKIRECERGIKHCEEKITKSNT